MVIYDLSKHFPRYTEFDPLIPVWCITPKHGRTIHRYYDTSPFSPSGRYVALLRMPFEDKVPGPGDISEIIIVDLETGEEKVVAESRAWATQVGAHVQWGVNDRQLFFNDLNPETWQSFGVKLDPISGALQEMDGTIYMVSPDGRWAASPCLTGTGITRAGYGIALPPNKILQRNGKATEDGIFLTNLKTGKCRMLISNKEIIEKTCPSFDLSDYKEGNFYGFVVKWSPKGDRLLFVLRWESRGNNEQNIFNNKISNFLKSKIKVLWNTKSYHMSVYKSRLGDFLRQRKTIKLKRNLITMKADGSDVNVAIPNSIWKKGGNHPIWCPDGENIMMNLNLHGDGLRFVKFRYDGQGIKPISKEILGSGHPTLHPDGRHILTDEYFNEQLGFGDGTTPIRLIDIATNKEQTLVRIKTDSLFRGALRVDPHPAWNSDFRMIAFNGFVDGTRRVYVADLTGILL